ncbi:hypothetical protein [Janthinobacterium aquaticum]|uniref:hypothetical protein n=1 Tax=Janthinobacterium sp. FT58W TaxID=2654254 RepID=UPI001264EDC8|nr:hypothetical protein [Janthinobacterium sp. FT58W]KAB8041546.1 hypothetical protein GCM43_17110 [Janthinobacterium sp. FT58W]
MSRRAPAFPYPLQPLRVPAGWQITVNTLFEVDPGPDTMQWFSSALLLWGHCSASGYCFNSHFEPEDDPQGQFVLELARVELDRNGKAVKVSDTLLEERRTRSRAQFVAWVEQFMLAPGH